MTNKPTSASIIGVGTAQCFIAKVDGKMNHNTIAHDKEEAMSKALFYSTKCSSLKPCECWTKEQTEAVFKAFMPEWEIVPVLLEEMPTTKAN